MLIIFSKVPDGKPGQKLVKCITIWNYARTYYFWADSLLQPLNSLRRSTKLTAADFDLDYVDQV